MCLLTNSTLSIYASRQSSPVVIIFIIGSFLCLLMMNDGMDNAHPAVVYYILEGMHAIELVCKVV